MSGSKSQRRAKRRRCRCVQCDKMTTYEYSREDEMGRVFCSQRCERDFQRKHPSYARRPVKESQ